MAAKLLSGYAGPYFLDAQRSAVRYQILDGSAGGFSWTDSAQGSTHRVAFCIPWEGIAAFRQYVLMATATTTTGGTSTVTRTQPMQSPFVAQFPNTYAVGITARGDGLDANVSDSRLYADILLDVEFTTLTYPTDGAGAFIEVNYSGSSDYDTVPDAKLVFAGNGEAIDHDAGILVGQLTIGITAHNVPSPANFLATVMPLKGKVNSQPVTIDGFNYPAGSLLFPTFELTKSVDMFGVTTAQATVPIIQRDLPWNQGIRSDGNVDTIVVQGTSTSPYQTADLNGLLSL